MKSVKVAYQEFTTGISGGKPARYYTADDIRNNRNRYNIRNHLWMAVTLLMERGMTENEACKRIHLTYKDMTVRQICDKMIADRRNKVYSFLEEPRMQRNSIQNFFGRSNRNVEGEEIVVTSTKMAVAPAPTKMAAAPAPTKMAAAPARKVVSYTDGDSSDEDVSGIDEDVSVSEQITASTSTALSRRVVESGRRVAQNSRRGGGGSAGGGGSSSGQYMSIANLNPLLRNVGGASIQF